MIWLPDGYALSRVQAFGWHRVVLSQSVWDLFIRMPVGVKGQSEATRIWDLLMFLRSGLNEPGRARTSLGRVSFIASVVNDTRDCCEELHAVRFLPTNYVLIARSGLDGAGSPCLVVTLPQEKHLR